MILLPEAPPIRQDSQLIMPDFVDNSWEPLPVRSRAGWPSEEVRVGQEEGWEGEL